MTYTVALHTAVLNFAATHLVVNVYGRLVCVLPARTGFEEITALVGHSNWKAVYR